MYEANMDNDLVPRRSGRLAAKRKYKAPKPKLQARMVLMKKLGLSAEIAVLVEVSFKEF